jgi:hypothetical protein
VAKVGMSFPLTGADATRPTPSQGRPARDRWINGKGGVASFARSIIFDSATPAAGQYDPAQAATNIEVHRRRGGVALIGPQMTVRARRRRSSGRRRRSPRADEP